MTAKQHSCRLLAVGDIMLHGKIAAKIAETGDPLFPFRKVMPLLADKDILFGNLETMVTKERKPHPATPGKYFSPPGTAPALREVGFDVVNLGHNHLFDWGSEGVEATVKELEEAGIAYAGVGGNYSEAGKPAIVVCKVCGRRFGFLCYTATYNTIDKANSYMGRPPKESFLRDDVAALRQAADTVVVSIHGGACLNPWPSPEMLAACRKAIDSGAHIVLGHHAHVMNGIQRYRGGLIAYALPDFVRPLPLDVDEVAKGKTVDAMESFALSITIGQDGACAHDIAPCILDDSLQTRPAGEQSSLSIRNRLSELSADIVEGRSTAKHMEMATNDFHGIYTFSLLRALRRGGGKWLLHRLRTVRLYHFRLLARGLIPKPGTGSRNGGNSPTP